MLGAHLHLPPPPLRLRLSRLQALPLRRSLAVSSKQPPSPPSTSPHCTTNPSLSSPPPNWTSNPSTSLLRRLGPNLICSKMADLVLIADSFPILHHLDISYPAGSAHGRPITNRGIVELSRRLPDLRRIDLSGNQCAAGSCVRLKQNDIRDCDFVTQKGIDLCLRRFRELDSISATGIAIRSMSPSFVESLAFARGLRELSLSNSVVLEELVGSIAEAGLPLKKLHLSQCQKLTYGSIRKLLWNYQLLEHLGLEAVNFLTDQMVIQL